jgi:hypothetical protein
MKRRLTRAMLLLCGLSCLLTISIAATAAARQSCPSNTVCTYNGRGVIIEGFGCQPYTNMHPKVPIAFLYNGCGTRVWLHQGANNTGWSWCISRDSLGIPAPWILALWPGNLQVSSNRTGCK